MAIRKYIVREGFVVPLTIEKPNGEKFVKMIDAGEEVSFDDATATLHAHKLEFARQADRDAALAAEKEAQIATAAANSPAELVQALVSALSQSLQQSGAAPAAQPTA